MARHPGELEGIEDERLTELAPASEGRTEQVRLDRGGDGRSLPLEQRRYRKPGRLARLRRAKGHQRMTLLGAQQAPALVSERQPPGRPVATAIG